MPPGSRLRLLLLLASGLFALVVRFVLVTPGDAVGILRYFGYWAIAAIVATGVVAVVKASNGWRFSRLHHLGPLLAAIGCALFLQIHEPRKLRVLYDEYVLVATSLQMHLEREAAVPPQAQYEEGRIVHLNVFTDKRPMLFSFLLSLVHDVSGYRVSNVFVLNGIISLALFWLVFWLGESIGGRRIGYLGMLLLAGIPLVAIVATSGVFDLLNLTLLAGLLLAARRYHEEPSPNNQTLLVMVAILIAQTRYESVLFLLSLAVIVAFVWWRNRRIELTWVAVVSPLMVLLPLLGNYVHLSNASFTQNEKAGVALFDFAHFVPNLGRAIYYLFDISGLQTNSPLVSYAGVGALLLLVVGARSVLKRPASRNGMTFVYYSFVPVVVGSAAMMFCYWWGHFEDPMASRLSLPLQFFLILSILVVLSQWSHLKRAALIAMGVAGLSIWAWTIPVSARGYTTARYSTATEMDWLLSVVLTRYDHRTLVVSESSIPFVAHRRPAMPFVLFNTVPRRSWELKTQGHYDEILVFQTIRIDPDTGKETDISMEGPGPSLILETVLENRFQQNVVSRISRLVGIKDDPPASDTSAGEEDALEGEMDSNLNRASKSP